MSKLRKYGLDDLKENMQKLSSEEISEIVGGDTYVFNRYGRLIEHEVDDCPNDLVVVSHPSGSESVYWTKGKMSMKIEACEYEDTNTSEPRYGSRVEFRNAELGLFKFFADNTSVEWNAFYNGSRDASDETGCFLRTISDPYQVVGSDMSMMYSNMIHNHPDYNKNPSTADRIAAEDYKNSGIYVKGKVGIINWFKTE